MKKISSILVLLVITSILTNAQNAFNPEVLSVQLNGIYRPAVIYANDKTERYSFTYDTLGYKLINTYEKLENGNWVNYEKYITNYYSDYKVSSMISLMWQNNQWVNQMKDSFSYNSNGYKTSRLLSMWQNGNWRGDLLDTYDYDLNGNMTIELSKRFSVWNQLWINLRRFLYTYDSNGNRLTILEQSYSSNWEDKNKTTKTYDSNNNVLTIITEKYESYTWKKLMFYTYTYDSLNQNKTMLVKFWNNDWVNDILSTYTYDSLGNKTNAIDERWIDNQWKYYWRDSIAYDSKGNKLFELSENYLNDNWVGTDRYTFTYDEHYNKLSEVNEKWVDSLWVNYTKITCEYDINNNMQKGNAYSWNNNNWELSPANIRILYNEKADYIDVYAKDTEIEYIVLTDVKEEENIPIDFLLEQNYPNPFNPYTNIKFTIPNNSMVTLKIYDILGKEVATLINEELNAGSYSRTWNAVNMASGIYFYQLSTKNNNLIKKMILIK